MTSLFKDIKIIEMDDQASRPLAANTDVMSVALKLSAAAPPEWTSLFGQLWTQHFYMMKRGAQVFGNTLRIECLLSELKDEHIPELNKVIAETNREYVKYAEEQARIRDSEDAKRKAIAQALKDAKDGLKFD